MNAERYEFTVGIDWASEAHQVTVVDAQGTIVARRSVEHSGAGIARFIDWLTELVDGDPRRIAVAIEVPRGALVETLLDRGMVVYFINPKQLDRFRDRHTVAGAKDDRLDSYVLGDALRTDLPRFRRAVVDDPLIIQLRELSRVEEDLQQEMARLHNRLRDQVYRFFPQLLPLCPGADEPWFWALLELAPTPAQGQRLRAARVGQLLRTHRIRRLSVDDVLTPLQARAVYVAPGTVEAASAHIALLLPRLRLLALQRKECMARIEILLKQLDSNGVSHEGQKNEHRDVDVLDSVPGIGRIITATMLGEAPQALKERDYPALRAQAGVAPVTRRSGKRKLVIRRHACNHRLANALFHAARVHAQCDPYARALYAALRQRGHSHGRALRTLADRLLRIIVAMLRTGTLYDPNRQRRLSAGQACHNAAA